MKKHFSEYKRSVALKNVEPPIVKKRLEELLSQGNVNVDSEPSSADREFISGIGVLAELQMRKGDGIDYFVTTSELESLIKGMVRTFTPDVLDVFAESRNTAFIIHPPSPSPAVLVGIYTINSQTFVAIAEGGGDGCRTHALMPRSFTSKAELEPETEGTRLAIGLALYARFFPDAIKDGLPECAKHPAHYKGRACSSVSMSVELIDRVGISPHIRNTHFRFLSSPRYTNKRNTYVLVKESFVKGKCKIVVEAES